MGLTIGHIVGGDTNIELNQVDEIIKNNKELTFNDKPLTTDEARRMVKEMIYNRNKLCSPGGILYHLNYYKLSDSAKEHNCRTKIALFRLSHGYDVLSIDDILRIEEKLCVDEKYLK